MHPKPTLMFRIGLAQLVKTGSVQLYFVPRYYTLKNRRRQSMPPVWHFFPFFSEKFCLERSVSIQSELVDA
jgi:hypothetical protein